MSRYNINKIHNMASIASFRSGSFYWNAEDKQCGAITDMPAGEAFNLKPAVEGEKDVQDIDVHGRIEKRVVTLLVMRAFSNIPGALRACGYFRHPTAVFRFKDTASNVPLGLTSVPADRVPLAIFLADPGSNDIAAQSYNVECGMMIS